MRRGIVTALVGAGLLVLSACGMYEIDIEDTKATKVEGTANLWKFCDDTTLIYFQNFDGQAEDEIVAVFSWGCDGKGNTTKELPGTLGDANGGDTGNGDK